MVITNIYKVLEFIIVFVFTFFISDLRTKPGMRPLLDKSLIITMKLCYPIPISIYLYTLWKLKNILPADIIAMGLTILGTALVIKGKTDLAHYHSWVGFYLESTRLIVKGIYALIRHPIYTGIYIFIFGGLLTTAAHSNLWITLITVLFLSYIMAILAISARKETVFLSRKFGKSFEIYKKTVHAFLPLRRYTKHIQTSKD